MTGERGASSDCSVGFRFAHKTIRTHGPPKVTFRSRGEERILSPEGHWRPAPRQRIPTPLDGSSDRSLFLCAVGFEDLLDFFDVFALGKIESRFATAIPCIDFSALVQKHLHYLQVA